MYLKKLKIGRVTIKNNLVLAPMAAVNCPAFRALCSHYGAGLTYTQMIDVSDLRSVDERFIDRLSQEKVLSVQLIGSVKEELKAAVEAVEEHADIIDINLGCRERPMLAKKAGAFLLKHPEQIARVVGAVIGSTNKPVTAKIRSGWDEVNAPKVAAILEDLGVDAIAVHPRTKIQGYQGKADWSVIRAVREKVDVPVIGNGDITRPQHARAMFEKTGCDAVMVGRAAKGRPSIFGSIAAYLSGGIFERPKLSEQTKDFIDLYFHQMRQSASELRQHMMWQVKAEGSLDLKKRLDSADSIPKIMKIMSFSRKREIAP